MIIVIIGGDSGMGRNEVRELMEMELMEMNPYYGHQQTFGSDWKIEQRLHREEKVKGAQSYKRKNQNHPVFRR